MEEANTVEVSGVWIVDSGMMSHIVKDHSLFQNYQETPSAKLKGAGEIDALGHGDVTNNLDVSGKAHLNHAQGLYSCTKNIAQFSFPDASHRCGIQGAGRYRIKVH